MERMKCLPLEHLLTYIYPNLYPIHNINEPNWRPKPVQLTFSNIDRNGVYLLDTFDNLYLYICKSVHPSFLYDVFNVNQWNQIPDDGDTVATEYTPNNQQNKKLGLIVNDRTLTKMTMNGYGDGNGEIEVKEIYELLEPLKYNPSNTTSAKIFEFIGELIKRRPLKPYFHVLR